MVGVNLTKEEDVDFLPTVHLPRRAVKSSCGGGPLANHSPTTVSDMLMGEGDVCQLLPELHPSD